MGAFDSPPSAIVETAYNTVFHLSMMVCNASYLDYHLVSQSFCSLAGPGTEVKLPLSIF